MLELPHTCGRYRLIERIAQGGMAEIYRAEYFGDGGFVRTMAVKRILPQWSQDPQFSKMLQDEAKLLVKLQHQNIVQVFELAEDEGIFYISMEYVDGVDLRALLQALRCCSEKLAPKFVYWIVSDVLRALAFAHGRVLSDGTPLMIVHRDISPQNILIARHGEVKVADFGIAKGKHRQDETALGQLKGKLAYMSPEQARGEAIDSRSDLFSLGVVFFEMLTGARLFDGDSDLKILQQVQEAMIPSGWERDVAPEVRAILRRCLKKNPDERYQTAEEMLTVLSQYIRKINGQIFGFEIAPHLCKLFPEKLGAPAVTPSDPSRETVAETRPPLPVVGRRKMPGHLSLRNALYGAAMVGAAFSLAPQSSTVRDATAMVAPKVISVSFPVPLSPPTVAPPPDVAPPQSAAPVTTVPKDGRGRLSVRVRPWGYVTIPGVVSRKEAPVALSLADGNYQIKVLYEPTQQWLSARATVKSGAQTNCQASFGTTPQISCR